jgi:CBS domain-containing protein
MIFNQPITEYMTSEVQTCSPLARLPDVARTLERWNISSLPVTDAAGRPAGIVSRSDLLHVGRASADRGPHGLALRVPDLPVAAVMTRDLNVIGRHVSLAVAAGRLWREHLHRLFVVHDERIIGVLSTTDVAVAVRDAGIDAPLETIMTSPILTIKVTETLEAALSRLEHAGVTGLIVVEDDLPVGVFTQVEALASRGMPCDTPVEDVFDQALICLPAETRMHRAAAMVARLDVRRVVVSKHREAVGVVSGLDFARVVAAV